MRKLAYIELNSQTPSVFAKATTRQVPASAFAPKLRRDESWQCLARHGSERRRLPVNQAWFWNSSFLLYDLDLERGTVMIREGKGKKDRLLPIGTRAAAWLNKYL